MIFKTQPKIFNTFASNLPFEAAKLNDHQFPDEFILSSLTNKFVSKLRPNTKYNKDLLDYLCEVAYIIKFSTYLGDSTCSDSSDDVRDSCFWFWYRESIIKVTLSADGISISISCTLDKVIDLTEFEKFKNIDNLSRVSILIKTSYGLESKSIKIDPIEVKDINLNYGKDFCKVHENITTKLNKKTSSIMFFHGPPGCGKSSYIKYLTSIVKKEFIFIPVAFAGELSSPEFMSLLLEHKDSILILEDSEKVVQSREVNDQNVSTVSTLLNISDGILGSMLNTKIIATYNGDRDKVDKALLRPGRLAIDHTFGKLSPENATALAKQLGKDVIFNKEMSLAEVYNFGDNTGFKEKEVGRIGFRSN